MNNATTSDEGNAISPRSSEYDTPQSSEYDTPKSSLDTTYSPNTNKITTQLINKTNPMSVGKYKDCSKMNIDVITDPKELHARYQVCCPYTKTPFGAWKTSSRFCKKLESRYKGRVRELNQPLIDKFNSVSQGSVRDSDLSIEDRDSDLSTVDNNVLKGGRSRKIRRYNKSTKKRRRCTKCKRNKRKSNKRNLKSKRNNKRR